MLDIVTVTSTRDRKMFLLHAYSLNKFIEEPFTHWVVIEDERTPVEEWENLLNPLYKKNNLKIIYSFIPINEYNYDGWIRQQVIKLSISKLITNKIYYILDTKNILFKKTNFNDWNIEEGTNAIQEVQSKNFKKWIDWVRFSSRITSKKIPKWMWSPETPFKAKTETVKNIIKSVDLKKLFISNKTIHVSEFLLYNLFSKTNVLTQHCNNHQGIIHISFWSTDQLIDISELKDRIKNSPYTSIITIHRFCMEKQNKKLHDIFDWLINECGFDAKYVDPLRLTI